MDMQFFFPVILCGSLKPLVVDLSDDTATDSDFLFLEAPKSDTFLPR